MSRYYVYELWNPLKNQPFYVGKGSFDSPPRIKAHLYEAEQVLAKKRKSSHKINTILKIWKADLEVENKIVYECETEIEAFNKETELIKFYGRRFDGGMLTNVSKGGEGFSWLDIPEELRRKWSKQREGTGNGMYGKHHSEKSRNQISRERKERIAKGQIIPTKHSDEWKKHLRENNAGGKSLAMPIYAIDKNGFIVHEFHSANSAADFMNGQSGNICLAANEKKDWTSYGYYWRYKSEYDSSENFVALEKKRLLPRQKKSLLQIKSGIVLKEWLSIKHALDAINGNYPSITSAIKNCKEYRGYHWKIKD